MKFNLLSVFLVILMATLALCQEDDEAAITYQVMHKLSSQSSFVKRGDITLKSNKSQTGNYIGAKDSGLKGKINKNDLYLVEIRDLKGNVLSSSYTNACFLSESDFKDDIVLHVNGEGNVLFADYFTDKSTCPEEIKDDIPSGDAFKTTVRVLKPEQGQRPHLTSLKYFKREQAKKQMKEQGGFFSKYWMYILPVVIVFLFSGGGGN